MILTESTSAEWITDQIKEIRPYTGNYAGCGIVIPAGGIKFWTNSYAGIRLLRHFGCKLPIEVWYLGEKEYDSKMVQILNELNVECIDAEKYMRDNPQYNQYLAGWELKPFAVIHSKFKEVLNLDADVFCDGDPTFVFDSQQFQEYGAIFCPDYNVMNEKRSYWNVMGISYRSEPEIESGIIFVDKEKHWKALNLTNKLCEYGLKFFFNHCYGDKDLFRAAFHRCNSAFYMIPNGIHSIDGTMVQHAVDGRRMFYHRNLKKLHLILNESVAGFANEELIFQYLKELKLKWNPYVIDETPSDQIISRSLEGMQFNYYRVGLDKRKMIFLRDHIIGEGKAACEQTYCVQDNKLLIIGENSQITAKLEQWSKGWIGYWLIGERCLCVLEYA